MLQPRVSRPGAEPEVSCGSESGFSAVGEVQEGASSGLEGAAEEEEGASHDGDESEPDVLHEDWEPPRTPRTSGKYK